MTDYNPDLQAKLVSLNVSLAEIALNNKIPSLWLLQSTFGDITPIEWLKIQFGSLNDYAEQSVGMNVDQLNELSALFLAAYCYLNVAEVCLFIARLKLGKYGQFYGAVGPMKIMSATQEFIKERRRSIEARDREVEMEKRERNYANNSALSVEAYDSLKEKAKSDYSTFRKIFPKMDDEKGNLYWRGWCGDEGILSWMYPNIPSKDARIMLCKYLCSIQLCD